MIPIIKGARGAQGARPPGGTPSGQVQMPAIPWKGVLIAVLAVAVLLIARNTFIIVQAGERAVIYSKLSGVKHYQLSEGLHLNVPIVYEPTIYDTKTLTYTMSGSAEDGAQRHGRQLDAGRQASDDSLLALTSDGLPVTLDISVRFHVDPQNVWRLHQDIGPDFIDKVVRPQARSTTRMVFAEFPVIDVYSGKRQVIVERIQSELAPKMAGSYIVLDEVLLRDIRFPPEFQSAIEAKQVAQQEAQQMIFDVQRAESERQQRIIEAQGEASAISKKARALAAHPQLLQYEFVQSLPSGPKVVVTDSRTIINLGDALTDAGKASPVASGPSRRAQPEEAAQ